LNWGPHDYKTWDQKEHAHQWILFPGNIGPRLSVDETSFSNGELYTLLTNNEAKGRKGAIVARRKGLLPTKLLIY
jgi:hypothetical protein